MRLYIPSLSRANNQVTWCYLTKELRSRTELVVYEREAAEYARRGYPVLVVPPEVDNLAKKRSWIGQVCPTPKFVIMDDDMDFYHRPVPGDYHLREPSPSDMDFLFKWVESLLDLHPMVGVSAREGNNRCVQPTALNQRMMRFLAYRKDVHAKCVHGRVRDMDDFDTHLQILRMGYDTLVIYQYAQGHKGTNTPGGCSISRNHHTHENDIKALIALHPGLVVPRWKENKTGGEFGKRLEVTIYWKKARASASSQTP